jgi:hypothetical protein
LCAASLAVNKRGEVLIAETIVVNGRRELHSDGNYQQKRDSLGRTAYLACQSVHSRKEYPVKRLAAVFALSTLAAATVGLAQQATQQTPAQPSATTSSNPSTTNQAPSPSDPSAGNADKQALVKDCMTQVQAANPNVSMKEIQAYCDEEVNKIYTSKPN